MTVEVVERAILFELWLGRERKLSVKIRNRERERDLITVFFRMTLPPPAALQKAEAEYFTETWKAVLFTDITDIRDLVDRCLLPPS